MMLDWLKSNIGTIVVSLALGSVIALVIVRMVKDKKKGRMSCGCGCTHCAMAGVCHRNKIQGKA